MAIRLARKGEEVVFIVANDGIDTATGRTIAVQAENHFLFNSLKDKFKDLDNISLELVHFKDVLEWVKTCAKKGTHVMVDEFTCSNETYASFDEDEIKRYQLPKVNCTNTALG